jgi:ParB-like chromosome segregation protein Spo0J
MGTGKASASLPRTVRQEFATVEVSRLQEHPRNPRRGEVDAIQESIETNGFYGTIVAQESTGYILAGNHRWKAAVKAGLLTVPVMWVAVDDEAALRILLADNRTADLADYDNASLVELLAEIANSTGTLLGTGYDQDALDDLIAEVSGIQPEKADSPTDIGGEQTYAVTVPCRDEAHQKEIHGQLSALGLDPQLVTN